MSASGTAVLDFGAYPGAMEASVAVTGQALIVPGSLVEAWIQPVDADDEARIWAQEIEITATSIISGTGFTIRGDVRPGAFEDVAAFWAKWGSVTVTWVWV